MKTKKMKTKKMKTQRNHKKRGGAYIPGTPRTSTPAHTLTPNQQAERDRQRHKHKVDERYVGFKVEKNRREQEAMQEAMQAAMQAATAVVARDVAMHPEEQAAAMREQDAAMQEQQSSNTHRSATRATPFVLPDLPDLGLIETRELGENYVNIAAIRSQWWNERLRTLKEALSAYQEMGKEPPASIRQRIFDAEYAAGIAAYINKMAPERATHAFATFIHYQEEYFHQFLAEILARS